MSPGFEEKKPAPKEPKLAWFPASLLFLKRLPNRIHLWWKGNASGKRSRGKSLPFGAKKTPNSPPLWWRFLLRGRSEELWAKRQVWLRACVVLGVVTFAAWSVYFYVSALPLRHDLERREYLSTRVDRVDKALRLYTLRDHSQEDFSDDLILAANRGITAASDLAQSEDLSREETQILATRGEELFQSLSLMGRGGRNADQDRLELIAAFEALSACQEVLRTGRLTTETRFLSMWNSLTYVIGALLLLLGLSLWLLATRDRNRARVQELRHRARRDTLTGCLNRGGISELVEKELNRSRRNGRPIALIIVDIDRFKQINDSLGHLRGDEVLREATTRLESNIRDYDSLGRYGGDEFILLLPDCDRDETALIAKRLTAAFAKPFVVGGKNLRVTVSIGGVVTRGPNLKPREVFEEADRALYAVKENGRNDWRIVLDDTLPEESETVLDRVAPAQRPPVTTADTPANSDQTSRRKDSPAAQEPESKNSAAENS